MKVRSTFVDSISHVDCPCVRGTTNQGRGVTPRRQTKNPPQVEGEPVLRVNRSQLDGEIGERLQLGQQLLEQQPRTQTDLERLEGEFHNWDEFNEQLFRARFTTAKVADEYRRVTFGMGRLNPQEELYYLKQGLSGQIRKLTSIRQKLPLYETMIDKAGANDSEATALGTKVFIVHGHDGDVKLQVAEYLEQVTGERPVILHEQADAGQTIIEKFEAHASEAGFAVILLTADDLGKVKGATNLSPRARQNVVLEFGFFIGRLGRSRVVALYETGVELPSDLNGVLYKPLTGNWHTELARELRVAGIDADLGKLR